MNFLAGLAVVTMMTEMDVGQSLQRYAILTFGDGMVSQIPSLLVSIAAGVVITRVTSAEDSGGQTQLAGQIFNQLSAHPRALLVAALAFSSFLLVPGLPKWSFGACALVMAAIGFAALTARRRGNTPGWISHHEAQSSADESSDDALTYPVALRLSQQLRGRIDHQQFDRLMVEAKNRAEAELGPVFPRLQLLYSPVVEGHGYQLLVQDVVVERGLLQPGRRLLDPAAAASVPADATPAEPFGPFSRVVWVDDASAEARTLSCEEVLSAHVESVARRHAPRLIGLQEVQRLIHWMQRHTPELAAELSRVVPAQRVAETLKRLLQEGVPVRNLKTIFESLVRWAPKEEDGIALAELVRVDLGAYITSRHVGPDRRLAAVLFDAALMDRIVAAVERSPRGNLLLLSPAVKQDVLEQLRRVIADAPPGSVLVVSTDVRRYVRMLVEQVAAHVPVLSYQEIDDDVNLQPVGWITNPQQP
jgi:type III secretion protein V